MGIKEGCDGEMNGRYGNNTEVGVVAVASGNESGCILTREIKGVKREMTHMKRIVTQQLTVMVEVWLLESQRQPAACDGGENMAGEQWRAVTAQDQSGKAENKACGWSASSCSQGPSVVCLPRVTAQGPTTGQATPTTPLSGTMTHSLPSLPPPSTPP